METVRIIGPDLNDIWDRFVAGHPFGWIVHLSSWKNVIESAFPHIKGHCLALIDQETNTIKAGLSIYEIRSWLTGNRLVSIPFATLSDPLVSNQQQFKLFLNETKNYAKKHNLSPVNIRLFQTGDMISNTEESISVLYKTHYFRLTNDIDKIKKSFDRNIRRIIKTFESSPLTIKISNEEEDVSIFYHLYTKTRKRLGLPTQPYSLINELFRTYSPQNQILLLTARVKEKPVGGLVVFKYKDRVSSEFLASELEFRHLNTDHFLYWNAIKIACEEGYSIYDFGRTAISNTSLADFKKRWGTTELPLPEYSNPPNSQREESIAYKMIQNLCKNSPMVLFQPLSRFCYHHLG